MKKTKVSQYFYTIYKGLPITAPKEPDIPDTSTVLKISVFPFSFKVSS